MSEDPRDPLATLLDLFVYAPIGAALHGPEAIDELAGKGRQDVANARVVGKLTVDKGRREAIRLGADIVARVAEAATAAARAAGAPVRDAPRSEADVRADGDAADPDVARSTSDEAEGPRLTVVPDAAPPVEDLAIPDYDNLSASQVVPRLDDLADDELRAVQEYERAHRGRMTILSRIAQLQAS